MKKHPNEIDCGETVPNDKPARLADRITKGVMSQRETKHDDDFDYEVDNGNRAVCAVYIGTQSQANAELIAEAFNITNQTGLSPKELMEQRDELAANLRELIQDIRDIKADYPYIKSTIRKCESFLKKLKP